MVTDFVTEYARKVYKGDIVASHLVKKQCERHLTDIKENVYYTYSVEKANHAIKFFELLPDVKTGEPTRLALFQKFIIGSLYGWVDPMGNRRFTKAYISLARKNGRFAWI